MTTLPGDLPVTTTDLPERFDLASDVAAHDRFIALRALFPEAFRENKIDFDALRRSLGDWVDPEAERFGLTWPGKADCTRLIQESSTGTLVPMPEDSEDWDTTQNVIIEGDNLEVLKLLQKAYYGKVKMIYIDPPYNTGKEFIYPDNFREGLADYLRYSGQVDEEGFKVSANAETDGRYHSKWLSLMYPRLFLARNLLSEDGVLFVSIDDHEVQNLRPILNEIFGEENAIATFVWKRKAGGGDDSGHVAAEHDYILCYARDEGQCHLTSIMHESPSMTAKYNRQENGRRYYLERLDKTALTYSATMDFPIECPDGSFVSPPQPDPARPSTAWRWGSATVEARRDELEFLQDPKTREWRIYTRTWMSTDGVTPRSLLVEKEHGRNRDGTQELAELLGPKVFTNPKPTRLLRHLLNVGLAGPDELVMDFFAGSGSLGHALIDYNADNGTACRYLMVQLPEPTEGLAEAYPTLAAITRERMRAVAGLHRGRQASLGAPAPDVGFRAFRLSSSNFRVWDTTADELEEQLELSVEHVAEGATEASMLTELLLKAGYLLASPVEMLDLAGVPAYSVADGALIVCLSKTLSIDAFEAMVEREPAMILVLDAGFGGSDELKVNALQTVRARNQSTGSDITLRVV
jgi:adenine-specific DNA-methyltransferase